MDTWQKLVLEGKDGRERLEKLYWNLGEENRRRNGSSNKSPEVKGFKRIYFSSKAI
jgi:hypothetical protein